MIQQLHFDSLGGASGDMILSVFADLGLEMQTIEEALRPLAGDAFHIETEHLRLQGVTGARVTVQIEPAPHAPDHRQAPHRSLRLIREAIETSDLPERARKLSLNVFERIGKAEAHIHGIDPEEVHFHEVGAVDSIVDIVGSCLGLTWLGIDRVTVGRLPLGEGTFTCAHGTLPAPSPASLELLRGHPVEYPGVAHEMVTPTGAGLLMEWKSGLRPPPGGRIEQIGYGFGQSDFEQRLNLLRATRLVYDETSETEDRCVVLETNLDDMSPEWSGALAEALLKAGALDVFLTPVYMKKQRPGVLLTILARPEDREALLQQLFEASTTFGVREHEVARHLLARKTVTLDTPYGPIRVKEGFRNGVCLTRAPEFEDCRAAADKHRVPLKEVYRAALAAVPALSPPRRKSS